jgi:iron complex outermembrane receptor protein
MVSRHFQRLSLFLGLLVPSLLAPLGAQAVATIRGTVTRAGDNAPLSGVVISVKGMTGTSTASGATGKYTLVRIPTGPQTLEFRWLGYAPVEKSVTVTDGMTVDVVMEPKPVNLADITVSAASREPERVVEAPAAVTTVEPRVLQNNAATGQAPMALAQGSGVDLAQSGVNDFNINSRGFNSSLNRRVLTLLDGRDLAIAFLGSQEWNSLPVATDELRSMELVRGPGSALYGANAFAGVINMTTLSPREAQGGKISVFGGELSSFKADGRWAGLFGNGSWGIRLNGGYSTNDTWTRSRTSLDSFDLRREYAAALGKDSLLTPKTPFEAIPLAGQTAVPQTAGRLAQGDRDPIKAMYGAARLDHYMGGSVLTVEGGASQVENETLVTGIGRVQVLKGFKPYGRVALNSDHFSLFGYMNHRTSDSGAGQRSLSSGALLIEKATISHVEAQGNTNLLDRKLRVIGGASFRQYNVNTEGTLMRLADDDRHDKVYSGYGQAEYRLSKQLRLVGAARLDDGDLFKQQFSPKGAIVFSPNENHAFRVTYNRAFQTPNYSEWYLNAAAAAPANLSTLEAGLRASALGPALAGVPQGTLFTVSNTVPVRARGNPNLDVEKTKGWEVGYKGALNKKTFVTVDFYASNIKDFVTDLLPGANPALFPYWTAPAAVPDAYKAPLVAAVKQNLGPISPLAAAGLTRLEDGSTAIVVTYANAGDVDQKGIDVGLGYQLTNELRIDGTYSWFDFTVNSQQAGDKLLPNTPKNKATFTASYEGMNNKFDANISARFVAAYDWAAGVFAGKVPASQSINASVGYQVTPRYRLSVTGTNVLDQKRFQLYGGSVIGRRVLAGLTARF